MAEKNSDKEPCLIGSKIAIKGHISGSQDLVVQGRVEGRVELTHKLTVDDGGTVEADVEVGELAVRGALRGDMVANKVVVLHAGAQVAGNIKAARVVIEDGARYSGSVEMDVELPADIKAKG